MAGKHRLKAGIPRVLGDHRTTEGKRYLAYCHAQLARLPGLPDAALPTLQAAGWIVMEVDRLTERLNAAHARRRQREAARLRRQLTSMRTQLVGLERRLEELAASAPAGDFVALFRRAVNGEDASR